MSGYARGEKRPAADPQERRLEDAQGRAALELERVRRLERMGGATSADVQAARADLSAAWEGRPGRQGRTEQADADAEDAFTAGRFKE